MAEPDTVKDKTDDVLSFHSYYKEYRSSDLAPVFSDIADHLNSATVTPAALARAASSYGTHSPKFPNSRSSVGALVFQRLSGNMPLKGYYSGGAKEGKLAKLLMRPIKIEGESSKDNFLDRLILGDKHVDALEKSFASAFGSECLDAVKHALEVRYERAAEAKIHHENMPVVFIPGPDGSDLQTTPLPPLSILDAMRDIKDDAYQEFKDSKIEPEEKGGKPKYGVSFGRWIRTVVSDKMQNVALNVNNNQYRFFSEPPSAMSGLDAEIWALKGNPDKFQFYDPDLAEDLLSYATRLDKHRKQETYVNTEMSAGTDHFADVLIRSARDFIDEILDEFTNRYPDLEVSDPGVISVLKSLPVGGDDWKFSYKSLNSSHFQSKLSVAGEKS